MPTHAEPQAAPAALSAAAQPLVAALRASGAAEATYALEGAELVVRVKASSVVPLAGHHAEPFLVASPVAGRFYHAESPGMAPAAAPGQRVEAGAPLGYLEAMKLVHPLPAPRGAWVQQLLVEDGAAVLAGQALVALRLDAPTHP